MAVVRDAVHDPPGDVITADLARQCVPSALHQLRDVGVLDQGSVALDSVDMALGAGFENAERAAPGEATDVIIWDDILARSGDESTLTRTFLSFMVFATLLAAIGVVTDSPITVVGAMVVGPEFGPLAGVAVGLMRRRWDVVRQAVLALAVGCPLALLVTVGIALLWRATGLVDAADLLGRRQTEFICYAEAF
jgi:Domain of unknown function (DUF389)